jgi:hypothetical protein
MIKKNDDIYIIILKKYCKILTKALKAAKRMAYDNHIKSHIWQLFSLAAILCVCVNSASVGQPVFLCLHTCYGTGCICVVSTHNK